MEKAMLHHGALAWAKAVVLTEAGGQSAWPMVGEVEAYASVTLDKGARQGASGTPMLWNVIVSAIMKPFLETWESAPCLKWCEALRR